MNKIILGLILFVSLLDAHNRYELLTEYKLVHACIDENSFSGVTKSLRDKCIKKVLKIESKYSESNIKVLDKEGKLKNLFSD